MMVTRELGSLCWPASQLPQAITELARQAGLSTNELDLPPPNRMESGVWIEWAAKRLGLEAEPLETSLRDLERDLAAAAPAVLQLSDQQFLAVCDTDSRLMRVLAPDLARKRIPVSEVAMAIRGAFNHSSREQFEALLAGAAIRKAAQQRTLALLEREQLGSRRWHQCWILRRNPGGAPARLLKDAGIFENGAALVAAHTVQYLLWIASWAILGSLSFQGRMDRAWLYAWALLLLTMLPFQFLSTWMQGLFTIGLGGFLKRRLLCGALKLAPDEMRHAGIGMFLGQALEAEAVEKLTLSGGVPGMLAVIEIVLAMFWLGWLAAVLACWFALTLCLAWRFLRRYQAWTTTRMNLTYDLVEYMVGYRTRVAQQRPAEWHEAEDRAMHRYLLDSQSVDRAGAKLLAAMPRGWLIAGLACLAPAVRTAGAPGSQTAVTLGGVLLAYTALQKLCGSFADIAAAWTAFARIAPLFHVAARPEILGEPIALARSDHPFDKIVEAERITFRHRETGPATVQGCSLIIRRGDHILLEGPSGGGKTTFASLLSGVRQPQSGLLLVNGLDRQTLGAEQWRKAIAAAPQFHENHILTETLAFNLLMGRAWPPSQADMKEAETVCRELGLGDLLDTMPSGLMQMVGEGGWQLSHGERSRIFIARALLQNADLVILDESFAALDPENARLALEYTIRQTNSLLVIAHP
ncbi:MAG: ATP-binding cassette domain-containing protein [Acidobacteriaceae bacterium]|nr:ATP-binding cassette domain-containing protein [Acidobacteriaceae bacterium]